MQIEEDSDKNKNIRTLISNVYQEARYFSEKLYNISSSELYINTLLKSSYMINLCVGQLCNDLCEKNMPEFSKITKMIFISQNLHLNNCIKILNSNIDKTNLSKENDFQENINEDITLIPKIIKRNILHLEINNNDYKNMKSEKIIYNFKDNTQYDSIKKEDELRDYMVMEEKINLLYNEFINDKFININKEHNPLVLLKVNDLITTDLLKNHFKIGKDINKLLSSINKTTLNNKYESIEHILQNILKKNNDHKQTIYKDDLEEFDKDEIFLSILNLENHIKGRFEIGYKELFHKIFLAIKKADIYKSIDINKGSQTKVTNITLIKNSEEDSKKIKSLEMKVIELTKSNEKITSLKEHLEFLNEKIKNEKSDFLKEIFHYKEKVLSYEKEKIDQDIKLKELSHIIVYLQENNKNNLNSMQNDGNQILEVEEYLSKIFNIGTKKKKIDIITDDNGEMAYCSDVHKNFLKKIKTINSVLENLEETVKNGNTEQFVKNMKIFTKSFSMLLYHMKLNENFMKTLNNKEIEIDINNFDKRKSLFDSKVKLIDSDFDNKSSLKFNSQDYISGQKDRKLTKKIDNFDLEDIIKDINLNIKKNNKKEKKLSKGKFENSQKISQVINNQSQNKSQEIQKNLKNESQQKDNLKDEKIMKKKSKNLKIEEKIPKKFRQFTNKEQSKSINIKNSLKNNNTDKKNKSKFPKINLKEEKKNEILSVQNKPSIKNYEKQKETQIQRNKVKGRIIKKENDKSKNSLEFLHDESTFKLNINSSAKKFLNENPIYKKTQDILKSIEETELSDKKNSHINKKKTKVDFINESINKIERSLDLLNKNCSNKHLIKGKYYSLRNSEKFDSKQIEFLKKKASHSFIKKNSSYLKRIRNFKLKIYKNYFFINKKIDSKKIMDRIINDKKIFKNLTFNFFFIFFNYSHNKDMLYLSKKKNHRDNNQFEDRKQIYQFKQRQGHKLIEKHYQDTKTQMIKLTKLNDIMCSFKLSNSLKSYSNQPINTYQTNDFENKKIHFGNNDHSKENKLFEGIEKHQKMYNQMKNFSNQTNLKKNNSTNKKVSSDDPLQNYSKIENLIIKNVNIVKNYKNFNTLTESQLINQKQYNEQNKFKNQEYGDNNKIHSNKENKEKIENNVLQEKNNLIIQSTPKRKQKNVSNLTKFLNEKIRGNMKQRRTLNNNKYTKERRNYIINQTEILKNASLNKANDQFYFRYNFMKKNKKKLNSNLNHLSLHLLNCSPEEKDFSKIKIITKSLKKQFSSNKEFLYKNSLQAEYQKIIERIYSYKVDVQNRIFGNRIQTRGNLNKIQIKEKIFNLLKNSLNDCEKIRNNKDIFLRIIEDLISEFLSIGKDDFNIDIYTEDFSLAMIKFMDQKIKHDSIVLPLIKFNL